MRPASHSGLTNATIHSFTGSVTGTASGAISLLSGTQVTAALGVTMHAGNSLTATDPTTITAQNGDVTLTADTGNVTLGLYKGNVRVLDRQSEFSLYDTSIAGFTMGADYDQKDAAGFINILGLPVRLAAAHP